MRILLIGSGVICLFLGFIGLFLPLLPTTPFVLVSAFCFARSSSRMHNWLLSNKTFGPLLRQWQQHRTIPIEAKKRAIALIVVSFSISILAFAEQTHLRLVLLLIGLVLILFIGRLPTRPPNRQETQNVSVIE
jgi:uncharacterized membrane protein YbaN (DUF454 family)